MTWKELGFKMKTYRYNELSPAELALVLSFGWPQMQPCDTIAFVDKWEETYEFIQSL